MTTIELSELGAIAERVKRGETVEVLQDGHVVATLVPFLAQRPEEAAENVLDPLEARMRELEAKGLVRRLGNGGPIPPEFYTEELPRIEGESLSDQIIRERHED
jgi:antitoxin (DNA-binding transcriptional repressor) of toxin-antitoxin stability system